MTSAPVGGPLVFVAFTDPKDFQAFWRTRRKDLKGEPAHVFHLFCSREADAFWNREIQNVAGGQATYTPVFIHQKPKVAFKGGPCELGDLLVVTSARKRGAIIRRAMLLQAKMFPLGGLSGPQDVLYENWPPFSYTAIFSKSHRVGRSDVEFERVRGATRYAQILHLNASKKETETVNLATDNQEPRPFVLGPNGLLASRQRRISASGSAAQTDWSRTVWDMIDFVGKCELATASTQSNRGDKRSPWFLMHALRADAAGPALPSDRLESKMPEQGFALVHIDLGEAPLPKPRLDVVAGATDSYEVPVWAPGAGRSTKGG